MFKSTLKTAFLKTIPVLIGYLFLGFSFGVLLTTSGFSPLYAPLMSLLVYSGSMQFVAVEIMLLPFNIVNAIILTLSVNARHIFYGLSLIERYKGTGKYKFSLMFGLTDETYALVSELKLSGDKKADNLLMFLITILNHAYWIIGGLIGAVIGFAVNFPSKGLEFTMTALFLVIFVEQWEKTKNHIPAICGIVITLLCRIIFGIEWFLIAAMVTMLFTLTVLRGKLEKKKDGGFIEGGSL